MTVPSPGSGPISPTSSSAPSTEAASGARLSDDTIGGAVPDARPRRVLYGRRSGPGLRPAQRERLERLLPELTIALPDRGELAPAALFDPPRQRLWLEIGFGGGEHLAWQASAHPRGRNARRRALSRRRGPPPGARSRRPGSPMSVFSPTMPGSSWSGCRPPRSSAFSSCSPIPGRRSGIGSGGS